MSERKSFVVQHSLVGVHKTGDVIHFTDEQRKNGMKFERLVARGAVREATDEEAKNSKEYGDSDADFPRVFPPVPFDVTIVELDPQRSESPPTNPQPGIDPDPKPIGGHVSGSPKPFERKK